MKTYQEVYPSDALLRSRDVLRPSAAELLNVEYFEAEPASMPYEVFSQHHILLNLNEKDHRVENTRDGVHRDFTYKLNEVVITPAGVKSGWTWHAKSKVIVVTLDPQKLEKFALSELGMVLGREQLTGQPQFFDPDLVMMGVHLVDALKSKIGSDVMFESFARIFLTKLLQRYGLQSQELELRKSFTSENCKRVLDYIAVNYSQELHLEELAKVAAMSPSHFSRVFKEVVGDTPYQFLMMYRIEQSKKFLNQLDRPLIDIALSCGFADQPHFTRIFKHLEGVTPRAYRESKKQDSSKS